MDNLDDSENNAKISDSAYSNSCSNSQSRRSHSSKSTHSGSHSSGSSGYGGKPSTSGSSNNLGQAPKKDAQKRDSKKKKPPPKEILAPDAKEETETQPPEPAPVFDAPKEEPNDVEQTPSPGPSQSVKESENIDAPTADRSTPHEEVVTPTSQLVSTSANSVVARPSTSAQNPDGFSCVISMHDGVVMYTTSTITTALGYPKEMWMGRSFIDFIHPRDRATFASQISNGLAAPKNENGTQQQAPPTNTSSTMVCRIRRYRGLTTGFGVKERNVSYMPFMLKLTFKNVSDEEGRMTYLVIQATSFFSAFKLPSQMLVKAIPFVIRHAANGSIEYMDPEAVPYLGFLPQDLTGKDALMMYHPDDLGYLMQVYEAIVREGSLPRCKPYRMKTQNGYYLKLETEWSTFINPWSKKLEFVIGKHHIVEGPPHPDVFQAPDIDKPIRVLEEERNRILFLRENIMRIMNEVRTKPAEMAKQQMSKRCQDLASFMESLMEEPAKTDEELRLEIQEADHSYYERDSVMLGGISPHHEYNDSKSSTETPLSYNQLNYNETLQRYFDSHQPLSEEDCTLLPGDKSLEVKEPKVCMSPIAQYSGDSLEISSCDSAGLAMCSSSSLVLFADYQRHRLTESLLNKHNAEMEKELMKLHRETRSSSRGEREKASNESRQKKKEHLARCNASYQPTTAHAGPDSPQPHGVKRSSKQTGNEGGNKHHCPSPRPSRRRHRNLPTSAAAAQPSSTITTTVAGTHWPGHMGNMNSYVLGVGMPQQMSMINTMAPMPGMPGMFPMYYAPTPIPSTSEVRRPPQPPPHHQPFQPTPMHCMLYGQPIYGQPIMYSPVGPQMPYPMQQNYMAQSMQYNAMNHHMPPMSLSHRNYEEACKPSLLPGSSWRDKNRAESQETTGKDPPSAGTMPERARKHKVRPVKTKSWRDKRRAKSQVLSERSKPKRKDKTYTTRPYNRERALDHRFQAMNRKSIGYKRPPTNSAFYWSSESTCTAKSSDMRDIASRSMDKHARMGGNSDEAMEKTDGESSYSSFYSSFFKTDSGSAEDSGDAKKSDSKNKGSTSPLKPSSPFQEVRPVKKVARRKMEPPWMEQVCVTSELIYKYQILSKSVEEALAADKEKLNKFEQPSLVNEQLGQLYLDMQLEGVASRLTLEEGITSSSSSGEETSSIKPKGRRRKREYSKLVMIYEEDAPLPSPGHHEDEEMDMEVETKPEAESKPEAKSKPEVEAESQIEPVACCSTTC